MCVWLYSILDITFHISVSINIYILLLYKLFVYFSIVIPPLLLDSGIINYWDYLSHNPIINGIFNPTHQSIRAVQHMLKYDVRCDHQVQWYPLKKGFGNWKSSGYYICGTIAAESESQGVRNRTGLFKYSFTAEAQVLKTPLCGSSITAILE